MYLIGGFDMNKYVNNDGTLKDVEILMDINNASNMYRRGELLETYDLLLEIINAIKIFEENN